ncbi:MAG: type II and III secretion system family protein [Alphaproteobacteria bacterium]|nr:type II and III secretion system family protein [Alphaproteobacteria bacterium]
MRLINLFTGRSFFIAACLALGVMLGSCAQVNVPDARNVEIPAPTNAKKRDRAINEQPDSVMYLPLGEDILVPEVAQDDPLPRDIVGPFELRNETLAGALQLILADYDLGMAFETNAAMERRITVANLSGELGKVVKRVCSLANLYCAFEDSTLVVKETQTFTVTLPPIGTAAVEGEGGGGGQDYLGSVSSGLAAILGDAPITDTATRTLVYTASQRTAALAERYFQRLRANTAMIVYETYIWEVQLSSGNSAGIDWSMIEDIGKFRISAAVNGSVASDFTSPISIGLPTTGNVTPSDFINFLSQFGAVKTISQPQITVLSGASAEMRVADTQNYVSEISTTFNDTQSSTSVSTDTVDSGFTLTIGSSWDKATVYTNVNIEITDVLAIDDFSVTGTGDDASTTRIQLPQTTERELNTQIRVRPGDSVLIGGLVRERDNFDSEGPGFMEPVVPQSRTAQSQNLELVIMLRPRVVVYTDPVDMPLVRAAEAKKSAGVPGVQPALATPESSVQRPVQSYAEPAPYTPSYMSPASTALPVPALPPPEPELEPEPVVSAPVPAAPVYQAPVMAAPPPVEARRVSAPPVSLAPMQEEPLVVAPAPAPEPVYEPSPSYEAPSYPSSSYSVDEPVSNAPAAEYDNAAPTYSSSRPSRLSPTPGYDSDPYMPTAPSTAISPSRASSYAEVPADDSYDYSPDSPSSYSPTVRSAAPVPVAPTSSTYSSYDASSQAADSSYEPYQSPAASGRESGYVSPYESYDYYEPTY